MATREAGERAPPLGDGYVVSISHKGRFRRLHWSGGCWRIPGVHYHNFEWCGAVRPENVNGRCKDCFPQDAPADREEEEKEAETSDGSASSSSSSTSSESAAEE